MGEEGRKRKRQGGKKKNANQIPRHSEGNGGYLSAEKKIFKNKTERLINVSEIGNVIIRKNWKQKKGKTPRGGAEVGRKNLTDLGTQGLKTGGGFEYR